MVKQEGKNWTNNVNRISTSYVYYYDRHWITYISSKTEIDESEDNRKLIPEFLLRKFGENILTYFLQHWLN